MRHFAFTFWMVLASVVFGADSLCVGDPRPKSPCAGWEALQQVRSLIPERIWEQEFSIYVDRKAFKNAFRKWNSMKHHRDLMHKTCFHLAGSKRYFLKSTFSGENARILDLYQEFEWSPYWKTPLRVEDLRGLEKQIYKENRP